MRSKTSKVYQHFNDVEQYLHQEFDIKVRADIIKDMVGMPFNKDILDCGCGDGSISLQFQSSANSITLVDISENMLERARQKIQPAPKAGIQIFQTEMASFCPAEKYDLVLGIGLLAHVNSIPETLKSLCGFLRTGGYCILQITDASQLFSKFLRVYNHFLDTLTGQFGYQRNVLSLKQTVAIAEKYGLEFRDLRRYSLTLPGFTSLMPARLMYVYHMSVKNNPFLASFGSDCIIKFRKR